MYRFLVFVFLFLIAWCGFINNSNNLQTSSTQSTNTNIVKEKKAFTMKFDRAVFVFNMNKKVIAGYEKNLSWMQQILTQLKDNYQNFNTETLAEFNKMMNLYKENVLLMNKLVLSQKNLHNCFLNKFKKVTIPKKQNLPSSNFKVEEKESSLDNNTTTELNKSVDIEEKIDNTDSKVSSQIEENIKTGDIVEPKNIDSSVITWEKENDIKSGF